MALSCWFRHKWEVHQYAIKAEGTGLKPGRTFVLCWRQCNRCGKSKLVHILA